MKDKEVEAAIESARQGLFLERTAFWLRMSLKFESLSPHRFGSSREEVQRLLWDHEVPRLKQELTYAERSSIGEGIWRIISSMDSMGISAEMLGVSQDTIGRLTKRALIASGKEMLELCRKGEIGPATGVAMDILEGKVTYKELGTTPKEIRSFMLDEAQRTMEGVTSLFWFREFMEKYVFPLGITHEDLKTSPEDMEVYFEAERKLAAIRGYVK